MKSLTRSVVVAMWLAGCGLQACDGGRLSPATGPDGVDAIARSDEDKPETGLQGQVPLADQQSGRSQEGYSMGLRLVGQTDILSRGSNFQMAWIGDCAYVTTGGPELDPEHELNGIAVIDVSDPSSPQTVGILRMPGTINSKTAVAASETRGVLVAGSLDAPVLEIYDASEDCRNPVHVSSMAVEAPIQGLELDPDGLTVYAVDAPGELVINPDSTTEFAGSNPQTSDVDELDTPLSALLMISLDDLTDPQLLFRWDPNTHTRPEIYSPVGTDGLPGGIDSTDGDPVHVPQPPDPERSGPPSFVLGDIDLNERGSRVYLSNSLGPKNGMMVIDVSLIQRRRSTLRVRIAGQLQWDHDAGGANAVQHFMIGERTYLLIADALPVTRACPWAQARMLDISKEYRPELLATIELEVNDEANCSTTIQDGVTYSAHYPAVDDRENATTAFISWFGSGLRVFDIRDPASPVEVAYYLPPPKAEVSFDSDDSLGYDAATDTWDAVTSKIRYRPESAQIWLVSVTNGFQVLEFTESAGAVPPPAAVAD